MVELQRERHRGRGLRADAERNRERLVKAAQSVFAEGGLNVALDEVATRAGVGIATLYRRFPTREELVAAAFEAKLTDYAVAAEEALTRRDPWDSFVELVERICAMQADDRGFTDLITMSLPPAKHSAELRDRGRRAAMKVIGRAQEAGALREDLVLEDLALLLMANAGVVRATRDVAPHAWRRWLAFMLDGLRVAPRGAFRPGPMPAPPTPAQMARILNGNVLTQGGAGPVHE
ncbi:TetR/AcrR family transcriptional regulator [Actinacidiphila rubida]|uniref:TetR/AcrR family transcriptional regulator n=1 Tax=Actinacidiphila rubida TaxID=310780 RepID=UPI001C4033E1|nr:TetR/AcrR family transcriptional regulator [Actinacidiphila rubida]